jgi:hypothetical protein
MGTPWHKSKKVCGTCNLWAGERKPQYAPPLKSQALKDCGDRGYCAVKRVEKTNGASCDKWELWPMLR